MNKKTRVSQIALATIAILVFPSLGFAEKSKGPIGKHDVETFFYNKGYKDGIAAGKRLGYAQAKKDFLEKLKRYRRKIKAMEAGKYLSLKHKITAPEIYQKKGPDGSISVVVKGCRIEKELSPQEILALPKMDGDGGSYRSSKTYGSGYLSGNGGSSEPEVSDSAFLPGVGNNNELVPNLPTQYTRVTYKYFPDTETYRRIFRGAGKPFSVVAGNKIKVIFPSEKDAAEFCYRYDLQPVRDVR